MYKRYLLLSFIILLKFLLHYYLIGPDYELHRDEFMHIDQGRHLDWGYLSVPPFTSWVSYIILLLGNDLFWIKFFPALFGALTIVIAWKIIEELKGGMFAMLLGSVAILFSAVTRINILYQPNSFDILAWTFLYYSVIKYINTSNRKWLWIAAFGFAIGFLNKYNIAFLVIGLAPALFFSSHKNIFFKKDLYVAAFIALILISPNLWWQYNNGFPVINHMKELSDTQLVNMDRSGFLKEQILFFLGLIFVLIAAFIGFFIYGPFRKYRFIAWSFVFTMIVFLYFKAKGYYSIGLYPVLLAFGAVYLEKILSIGWKQYLKPVAVLIPVVMFIPFVQIAFPIYSPDQIQENSKRYKNLGLLRWEDGKDHELPQDFADMIGWEEMASEVDKAYASVAEKESTIVLCDNYGQAGAINYYSSFRNINAVSMNADYINWIPLRKKIKHVILVQEINDTDKERTRERPMFKEISIIGKVDDPLAREYGTTIYLLKNAAVDINKILEEEIQKKKGIKE